MSYTRVDSHNFLRHGQEARFNFTRFQLRPEQPSGMTNYGIRRLGCSISMPAAWAYRTLMGIGIRTTPGSLARYIRVRDTAELGAPQSCL